MRYWLCVSATLLLACGPSTYGGGSGKASPIDTAENCVAKIDQSVCPAGSSLDLDAAKGLNCSGEAGVSVKDQSGKISGVCGTKSGCTFVCKFAPSLCEKYGFKTITVAKVECNAVDPTK
jgi:hypothetical protein